MSSSDNTNLRLPSEQTLQYAAKLSIVEDKPIMLDYWVDSCDKSVLIGMREDGDKLLIKNEQEYTSPISKIYKVAEEYIIKTENSIYVVSTDIPTRRVA